MSWSNLTEAVMVFILEELPLFDRIRAQSVSRTMCHVARHPRLFDPFVRSAAIPWTSELQGTDVLRSVSEQQRWLSRFECNWCHGEAVLGLHVYMLFVLPPVDVLEMQSMMRESPLRCLRNLFSVTDQMLPIEEHFLLKTRLVTQETLHIVQSWQPRALSWAVSRQGLRMLYCGEMPLNHVGSFSVEVLTFIGSEAGRLYRDEGGSWETLVNFPSSDLQALCIHLVSIAPKGRIDQIHAMVSFALTDLFSKSQLYCMSFEHYETFALYGGHEVIERNICSASAFVKIPSLCVKDVIPLLTQGVLTPKDVDAMDVNHLSTFVMPGGGHELVTQELCTVQQWTHAQIEILDLVLTPAARACLIAGMFSFQDLVSSQLCLDELCVWVAEMAAVLSESQANEWQTEIQRNYGGFVKNAK